MSSSVVSAPAESPLAEEVSAVAQQICASEAPAAGFHATSGDHTYAGAASTPASANDCIEAMDTEELLEMVLDAEGEGESEAPQPAQPAFTLKGNFICCSDEECRACLELPFRPSEIGFSRDPHVSMALDMTCGTWIYIPRVFSDTPVCPWMANYCIPDLDEIADRE
ncbi:protein V32 [Equid alphaherpesvirus 3]|uniref:Protein V32 n=1 Tax=Equid alphaherpesvirus 3 TaxID=80341 RepID=A0A077B9Q3_9ALPH|nr:protein V32 [Equid alphaherpesvirus 3]AIL02951.1 protein V32 [Equid alphaherpesvirus 3]